MIYIIYLCMFTFLAFIAKPIDISAKEVDFLWNGVYACILILPIWSGIRDVVGELKKINKALEKRKVGE